MVCRSTEMVVDMPRKSYPRWQRGGVERALGSRRVVLLEGPRQSGKTTLAETFISGKADFRSLDDPTTLDAAIADPVDFVRHGDRLMVIDEVQRAPKLLLAVKMDVDRNQNYGRYLLTGSAHIQSLPGVRESLAGRAGKVRLRPLAQGEILGRSPEFISNAFEENFRTLAEPDGQALGKDDYIAMAMRGGFPEALRLDKAGKARRWHADYLAAVVDRDLRDIAEIRRRDGLMKLVEALAAWSSKEADISKIGAGLRLARGTIDSYVNALEALHIVERVRPWHSSDYNRIIKRDKIFVTDAGFMSAVLKWRPEQVRAAGDLNGKLVETFVFNELSSVLEAQEDDYDLYHYRDNKGREVDLLVQNERGDLVGIEIKAGSSVDRSMFKHLDWFRSKFAKDRDFKGLVLYSGERVLSFGDDLWAVPISALWA